MEKENSLSVSDHSYQRYFYWLLLFAAIVFLSGLGAFELFDWDEINFAESSREMLLTGDFFRVQINFQPFWEKPPLFFWLQSMAMRVFGIGEFASRLPNAIFGIFTLFVLFQVGRKLVSRQFGYIWALLYLGSLLPHLYFKSGIIDPVFNFFIFLGIIFGIQISQSDSSKTKNALLAGLFIGLAVLTKGPVGLLIPLLTILGYWAISGFKKIINLKDILLIGLTIFLCSLAWYGVELIENGPWFITEFIEYQIELFTEPVAGHKQPWFYHLLVVFLGCFPLSIFALREFYQGKQTNFNFIDKSSQDFRKWMLCLFWVVMILFTIVSTKIVHYSSMAYLPLSYLAALNIYKRISSGDKLRRFELILFILIGCILGIVITALPILASHPESIIPYIDDPFAVASFDIDISWSGFEFFIGLLFLVGLFISTYLLFKNKILSSISIWALTLSITLLLASFFILPKVVQFSQGPATEFWKSVKEENAILKPIGYKSYAHYFYGQINPYHGGYKMANEEKWLSSKYDRPIYFMTKSTFRPLDTYPDIRLVGSIGGFRLYKKDTVSKFQNSSESK